MATTLGAFSFLRMHPVPVPASQGIAVESQPGRAGVEIFLTGVRGTECTVQTEVDVTALTMPLAWAAGHALIALYVAAKAAGPLALVHGGVACGNYVVTDVKADVQSVFGHGGETGAPKALVRADWKLIAV
jgi:hypothetical protein